MWNVTIPVTPYSLPQEVVVGAGPTPRGASDLAVVRCARPGFTRLGAGPSESPAQPKCCKRMC